MSTDEPRVVVIGAGIGGLTTAALLAKAGLSVSVLEAHVYAGGCAGTFYHRRFRFDAGATLAGGFYPGGPMDLVASEAGIERWPAQPADAAMSVHLRDGTVVTRYGDERRWIERERVFGRDAESFWRWQEARADLLWDLALRSPAWPPQSLGEAISLGGEGMGWTAKSKGRALQPSVLADFLRPVKAHLPKDNQRLRLFVDAQLLIAAQTTSDHANALYGASALDLPRRGVVHLHGGMGGLAETLADAIHRHGGTVNFRQEVSRIVVEDGRPVAVETKRGDSIRADIVIANLPPWNIANLLGKDAPAKLQNLPPVPKDGWGAFMVYAGVDGAVVPDDIPLHHQMVLREPLGEANSVFISISPAWDQGRGPKGTRAITMSTHTALSPWWLLHQTNRDLYDRRRADYAASMAAAAEQILPRMREATSVLLPGTPLTFQRFTRRHLGWVGGFPQTNLFRTWAPKLGPGLWMVGDSVFPGQSTAAVALGGRRVARAVLSSLSLPRLQNAANAAERSAQPTFGPTSS